MMTHAFNDPAAARFAFDNTYSRELEGFYVPWKAAHYAPFETLLNILSRPFDDQPEFAAFAETCAGRARVLSNLLRYLSDATSKI